LLSVLVAAACVYPGQEPTGLELSWRFVEDNLADGEEALRVRTCEGAEVSRVDVKIVDLDDEERAETFEFDCAIGYQTVEQFQTSASDAYIRLDSGDYSLALTAVAPDGATELLAQSEVDVSGRQITVEPQVLRRATFDWTIELVSTDACAELSLAVFHDDPAAALADFDEDAEDPTATRYRAGLATDRGIAVSGEPVACSAELAGTHLVADVDPGTYRLDVEVDGTACAIRLDLDAAHSTTTVDLAALPCNG
jgi:hypothetical protein